MLRKLVSQIRIYALNGDWMALDKISENKFLRLSVKSTPIIIGDGFLEKVDITVCPLKPVGIAGLKAAIPLPAGFFCQYLPQLAPINGMTVGEIVFRSPAMIWESEEETLALIPDLKQLKTKHPIPYIMDFDQRIGEFYYGVGNYAETGHVYDVLTGDKTMVNRPFSISFYLFSELKPQKSRDFRGVTNVLWNLFGKQEMEEETDPHSLECYVEHTYDWAFRRWGDLCWQEFDLNGRRAGGVAFIVTAGQKKGYGRENVWREPKSLWNQAWFCGLRSAYGYALWGLKLKVDDWVNRGEKALVFALSAPQTNGLFPGYYAADEENHLENGHWVPSSPRCPQGHEQLVHLLDASFTCYWMLRWYEDIRKNPEILSYVRRYRDTLVSLQRPDGGFPAWVNPENQEGSPYLTTSPETGMHVMLLALWQKREPSLETRDAILRAAEFLEREILPKGRWEDFETYWSCSKEWEGKRYGVRDGKSGLYNHCNFGMYWCAEAFLAVYQMTENRCFLDAGERVLSECSLYQQIVRPVNFPVETVGGFGVLNSDNEWNDARQSLFAMTYLRYFRQTRKKEYYLRALSAMKASFYMMYCPENPEVKRLYELAHPHFDANEYGFHMENFNHRDKCSKNGIGEFTIFDWGNGAACSSLAEFTALFDQLKMEGYLPERKDD